VADTLYINDDGIKADLDSITGKAATPIGAGTLRLFTAPTTVDHTTVFASMVEATFAGYAGVALLAANWAASSVAAHLASSVYGGTVTFTRSTTGAVQNIYGWYLTDPANTKLYACALFAGGPLPLTNAGDSITVVPTLEDESIN